MIRLRECIVWANTVAIDSPTVTKVGSASFPALGPTVSIQNVLRYEIVYINSADCSWCFGLWAQARERELSAVFDVLDTDGNGVVTLREFAEVAHRIMSHLSDEQIEVPTLVQLLAWDDM